MANILLCGETGAGKTTFATSRVMIPHFEEKLCDAAALDPDHDVAACEHCDAGGIIVTNVELRREAWIERFGAEAVEKRLIQLPERHQDGTYTFGRIEDFYDHMQLRDAKGRGPMFVIDEAHKRMPGGMRFPIDKQSGQRVDCFPNQLLLLFTDQRHHLINLVCIVQDPFTFAAPIRNQMHSTIALMNAESKGSARRYTTKIWNGPPPRNWLKAKEADDGQRVPQPYDAEAQKLFVSNSKSKAPPQIGRSLEGKYRYSRSIWKRPLVLAIPVLLLVVAFFGMDLLSVGSAEAAQDVAGKRVERKKASPAAVVASGASDAAAGVQEPVIADLSVVEQAAAFSDDRRNEVSAAVSLAHPAWRLDARDTGGPVLKIHYVDQAQPGYAYLAEYAAFWGYSIETKQCGWTLTRSDNVRHIYDNNCLGKVHYVSSSAAANPAASAASQVGSADSAAAARPVAARSNQPVGDG